MKNRIQLLKKIACALGIVLLTAGNVNADLVFSTDFSTPYSPNNNSTTFDGTTIAPESWFGSADGVGVANDVLSFANATRNRNRGSGVWLDSSGWTTGPVTVEFDVTAFTDGSGEVFFAAYAANDVGGAGNTVGLDLHAGANAGVQTSTAGTGTISQIGTNQTITAAGVNQSFTFDFNGTDDYVALVFAQNNPTGGATPFGSATLDNLSVSTAVAVPEPSSLALVGLGSLFLASRRRRA